MTDEPIRALDPSGVWCADATDFGRRDNPNRVSLFTIKNMGEIPDAF